MARVSTHLNFTGTTEQAFNFYKSVFGGEFSGGGIMRYGDLPRSPGRPPVPAEEKHLILHIELPITGGHILMGADVPASRGFKAVAGSNVYTDLEPDTKEETKKLFDGLSAGGRVLMDLQNTFWGAYHGSCVDKFGIYWMFNCPDKK